MIIIIDNTHEDITFREIYDNLPFNVVSAINTLLQEYAHIDSGIEYRSEEIMNV